MATPFVSGEASTAQLASTVNSIIRDVQSNKILRLAGSGETTIDVVSGSGYERFESVVPHNLRFIPAPLIYVDPPTDSGLTQQPMPYFIHTFSLGTTTDPALNVMSVASVDETNLTIEMYVKTTINIFNGTWRFKYYLLQEVAV